MPIWVLVVSVVVFWSAMLWVLTERAHPFWILFRPRQEDMPQQSDLETLMTIITVTIKQHTT